METRPSYSEILEALAPCGVDCRRCVAYARGPVKTLATDLSAVLEGFGTMAPKIADRVPALSEYGAFEEILRFLAGGECAGCRAGGAQLPFCSARACFRDKRVDFCFQCDEYPCGRNNYPENLERRWRSNNDRMQTVGVEQFYEESLTRPRY